ncbi:DUF3383 domain-containing protein [Serratia fonticola]
MTIPASNIVGVNPGVLSAGGNAIDINGLLLTHNDTVPIGAVMPIPSPTAAEKFFGASSTEAALATVYFSGYTNATASPGLLYFVQYPEEDVSAWLRSASLDGMTLAQLKVLSGSITLTVDGDPVTAATISLTAATSFTSAATIIGTALSLPVTYDGTLKAFRISSEKEGVDSTITAATGTLAESLKLTAAKAAVVSQGAAAGVPGDVMSAIVNRQQNWGTFSTTWEPELDDKVAFSAWTSGTKFRYAYVGWDTDPNAEIDGSELTWMHAVNLAKYEGTIPIYGDATIAAFVMGTGASIDFNRKNGRITFAFKAQGGLLPTVADETVAQNLIANGYNYYGNYATANNDWNFFYPGSISGIFKWADAYINQIWLNANMQAANLQLLMSVGSIPYNADGYALMEAAAADPINAALDFGAIRTGVTLSESQIAQVRNAVGIDVSGSITAKGYYYFVKPAAAQVRAARTSPSVTFYYTDGGSIQQIELASIEIE